MTNHPFTKICARASLAALLGATLLLAACDPQRISELEEGVSTEADVRARFGEPEKIWDAPGGGRTFEYPRQPAGTQNYMITIGPDGKMASLRQVLNPRTFAQVKPGMPMEQVRRMLGKPMKITNYTLKSETHYDWRYQEQPGVGETKVFTVVFDRELKVVSTMSGPDMERQRN